MEKEEVESERESHRVRQGGASEQEPMRVSGREGVRRGTGEHEYERANK